MDLGEGKAFYCQWTAPMMNRNRDGLTKDIVGLCMRELEGAEGANIHRFKLILFAQCSVAGCLL